MFTQQTQANSTEETTQTEKYRCSSVISILCNEKGGTLDDILVYKLPMLFLIVCNAVNTPKVLPWLIKQAQAFRGVSVSPYENYSMLSVQGPKAPELTANILTAPIAELKHNHCLWWRDILLSRTGYTGEEGFELIISKKEVEPLWSRFIAEKIQPCGLGARDTLRLEAGLPLYGHEYDEETSPLEAGYAWAVKLEKPFIGRDALLRQKEAGLTKKLVGIVLEEKAVPRAGDLVFATNGSQIGRVTSGTFSPTFKKPIALAYIAAKDAQLGDSIQLEIRGKKLPAKIVAKTFYKR